MKIKLINKRESDHRTSAWLTAVIDDKRFEVFVMKPYRKSVEYQVFCDELLGKHGVDAIKFTGIKEVLLKAYKERYQPKGKVSLWDRIKSFIGN